MDGDSQPLFVGDAIADPLTGLTAAVLAARARTARTGVLLDIAMSGVVAATMDAGDYHASSPAARRGKNGWVVDTAAGPVRVAAPRRRRIPGKAADPGAHTAGVLRELGIRPPAR